MTDSTATQLGATPETALVIIAKDSFEGIEIENCHLDRMFGDGWSKTMQRLTQVGERRFDVITIVVGERTETVWFDITPFLPVGGRTTR